MMTFLIHDFSSKWSIIILKSNDPLHLQSLIQRKQLHILLYWELNYFCIKVCALRFVNRIFLSTEHVTLCRVEAARPKASGHTSSWPEQSIAISNILLDGTIARGWIDCIVGIPYRQIKEPENTRKVQKILCVLLICFYRLPANTL